MSISTGPTCNDPAGQAHPARKTQTENELHRCITAHRHGWAPVIESWQCAPASPWPVPVDLQCCSVTHDATDAALVMLDAAELTRANGFRIAKDRNRFAVTRAALRTALARAAGCTPASLTFAAGPHGKPVEIGAAADVAFNVAHSGDYALIAVARAQAIGVDIEQVRDDIDVLALSEPMFTPAERNCIERAPPPDQVQFFFRQWVRKEAVLKGLGIGLMVDARTVESPPAGSDWILRDLLVPPGYAAALALLV